MRGSLGVPRVFFLLWAWAIAWFPAIAQKATPQNALTCSTCHVEAIGQSSTLMNQALQVGSTNPSLQASPRLTFSKGGYTYRVETKTGRTVYQVSDGKQTISLPIRWSFGASAETWLFERNGKFYEGLVSYYPTIKALDITIGDQEIVPKNLDEAVGRELADGDVKACFGCHSTNAVNDGKLSLDRLKPGVTCEHCHLGAGTHLRDVSQGKFDTHPPDLKKLSSEDISNFCGQCHRTWETVLRNRWIGVMNVRFQPYRLANSKCFDGTDPRISCVACHDPHENVIRKDISYDGKCLACHGSKVQPAHPVAVSTANATPKSCPVATSNCVSCHMPKVTLPGSHMVFTDHYIRIAKAGEPYPN